MALSDYFGWGSSSSASSSTSNASSPAASAVSPPPPPDTSNKPVTALNPKGIKPCCACPETKSARDDCFLQYGHEGSKEGEEGEGWRCRELVEAHRRCMKSLGFQI